MSQRVSIPVRQHDGHKWGWLSGTGQYYHEIVGYDFKKVDDQYTFLGGHRVRLYKVKGNVHFKVPTGAVFDIAAVAPAAPTHGRRHHKLALTTKGRGF
jgi:hypothetical protein